MTPRSPAALVAWYCTIPGAMLLGVLAGTTLAKSLGIY